MPNQKPPTDPHPAEATARPHPARPAAPPEESTARRAPTHAPVSPPPQTPPRAATTADPDATAAPSTSKPRTPVSGKAMKPVGNFSHFKDDCNYVVVAEPEVNEWRRAGFRTVAEYVELPEGGPVFVLEKFREGSR